MARCAGAGARELAPVWACAWHGLPAMSAPAAIVRLLGPVLVAAPLSGCSLLLDGGGFDGEAEDGAEPAAADAAGGAAADAAPDPDDSDGDGEADTADAAPVDAAPTPVDAAGAYSVTVTNGANGCGFLSWQEDVVTTGVPLTIAQQAGAISATVEGVPGAFLDLVLGSREFQGQVDGAELELTLFGTTPFTSGNCTYTVDGAVSATVDGDVIEGQIEYRPSTNGSPSCGDLETCVTAQQFNGTRSPS